MDFSQARRHMIDSQVLPNRVTDDRVIDAMSDLPREAFLPKRLHGIAYADEALSIAPGRAIMEPMIIARLLQAAKCGADDVALVVGCGAGYTSALLAKLLNTVVAVEQDTDLIKLAEAAFQEAGMDTVAVMEGALAEGYPDQAPYDVIFLNGAVEHVPQTLLDQLSDGGRLVAIEMEAGATMGDAVVETRLGGTFARRSLFEAGTPALPGFSRAEEFVF